MLQQATNDFSDENSVGCKVVRGKVRGKGRTPTGFHDVFRAEIYAKSCAVKLLPASEDSAGVGIGGRLHQLPVQQFVDRVKRITQVQHPNIAQLYAGSTNGPRRCLVLELMHDTLANRLLLTKLSWQQRTMVAAHTCRGLVHLHSQQRMHHRQGITSQDILLLGFKTAGCDIQSCAKIASYDFDDSVPPAGNTGLLADAFAFGIVLVELLANLSPSDAHAYVARCSNQTLAQELQQTAIKCGWTDGSAACARILTSVVASCTENPRTRTTPSQVLRAVEKAFLLAKDTRVRRRRSTKGASPPSASRQLSGKKQEEHELRGDSLHEL
jgi:hypothetical protein